MAECTCDPWIKLSMCRVGAFSTETDELVSEACPSRLCVGMVPLADGRIGDHEAIVPVGERCPWIGVRVLDDRADFAPSGIGIVTGIEPSPTLGTMDSQPLAPNSEYRTALREWRHALDAWNNAGEPSAGPEYDRMDTARERFTEAGRARHTTRTDNGDAI
ncbi:hypothetical protein [Nocardia sp. NPDC004604]|uniref:hypothetical protein n=1 Tax=Nocardia sp. NPDC004604 TaxID=3157013 RepID=UPI0033B8172F